MGDIVEMVRFSFPEDYWDTFAGKVRTLTLGDISAQADRSLHPDRLVWVIVGDRQKIETGIKELNLGAIHYLDADGNPVGG